MRDNGKMSTSSDRLSLPLPLVKGAQPPVIEIPVSEDLPQGALLRVAPRSHGLRDLVAQRLELEDGTVCEEVGRFSIEEHRVDWTDHPKKVGLLTVRLPRAIKEGEILRFFSQYGSLDYTAGDHYETYSNEPTRPYFAGTDWIFWLELAVDMEPGSERRRVSPEVHLQFKTGPAAHFQAMWKADGSLNLRSFDVAYNPVLEKRAVQVQGPGGKAVGTLDLGDSFATDALEVGCQAPSGSRYQVTDETGQIVRSNARPVTDAGQLICFGEFHWHCDLSSDGKRPLADALATARDELAMDFAGPSDHIGNKGDFGAGKTPEMQAEVLREFDEPGRFAVLPGAELSQRIGHANYYCDDIDTYLEVCRKLPEAFAKAQRNQQAEYQWDVLTAAMVPGHTFLVPHHTNTNSFEGEGVVDQVTGRPFWNAMTFPQGEEMEAMRLFEIYQTRGSFEDELPDPSWRIEAGGYGASARSALMKGYRCGFTGGTDNHQGWPGRNNLHGRIDGYTAVLADKIETASIWKALYQRRCYATTGARIICDVTLNGQPMGSELKLAWDASRKMDIKIYGTAPLETVEVISGGVVIDSLPLQKGSWDLEIEWEDERSGRPLDDVYYYLRIRQEDGNLAWLSPFWIDAL